MVSGRGAFRGRFGPRKATEKARNQVGTCRLKCLEAPISPAFGTGSRTFSLELGQKSHGMTEVVLSEDLGIIFPWLSGRFHVLLASFSPSPPVFPPVSKPFGRSFLRTTW